MSDRFRLWFHRTGIWWLFVAPSLGLLILFFYVPAGSAVYHSFFDWEGAVDEADASEIDRAGPRKWFVGLDNFRDMLQDPVLHDSVRNLTILTVALLCVGTAVPMFVAELISHLHSGKWKQFYQVVFLIPGLVPLIVVFLLWEFIYDPYFGPLSAFMSLFGFDRTDFLWLAGPRSALCCLIFIGFPWVSGTSVLIYLAGLNNIPASVLDSCRLEGLNGFGRFWQVDVFFLVGQIKLLLITGFIGLLQMFAVQLIVTEGRPGTATMVPAYHMYESAFVYDRLGYASAIGLVLAVVIFVFSVMNLKFLKTMEL